MLQLQKSIIKIKKNDMCKNNNYIKKMNCIVVIAFQGTFVGVPQVNNHRVILSGQVEGIEKYAVTKYHILFTKKTIMKIINIKNNCIVRIKIKNNIQNTKIHWSYVTLLFIFIKHAWNNKIIK